MKLHSKIMLGLLLGAVAGLGLQYGILGQIGTGGASEADLARLASVVEPLRALSDLFMGLLKMLIVPLILTSIISGVAGLGGRDLGRLGARTFGYYLLTSLLAIIVGLTLVNVFAPGEGAVELGHKLVAEAADNGFATRGAFESAEGLSIWDILVGAVPKNVFAAMSDNRAMLQVIVFALLVGFFISKTAEAHRVRMTNLVESAFAVMMEMAQWVLGLLPYGVFVILARVVAETDPRAFAPLLAYMAVVAGALLIHAVIVLSLVLRVGGKQSPSGWARAMSPALLTAFSTSSSSLTLPVSLETVEKRGGVSNRVTSFVLPLGATVNMDGTALYECIGVIFLSQVYASVGGPVLGLTEQLFIVLLALLASIGAAGIPSAGLVMMITILSALDLPTEGAALLLAVDRPLDMLRTTVNVYSDSVAARCVARMEGEEVVPRLT